MTIGVLAVQGAFIEHEKKLDSLGINSIELRQKSDVLKPYDALILPGGESTVQGKLLKELDMFNVIKEHIVNGMPVLATCAGMILLAEKISNDARKYFGTMPIAVKRNAYGRQLGSFHVISNFTGIGNIHMTFIRAPFVESAADGSKILAEVNGNIVAVQYGNQIALSFHPELDTDLSVYKMFIQYIS